MDTQKYGTLWSSCDPCYNKRLLVNQQSHSSLTHWQTDSFMISQNNWSVASTQILKYLQGEGDQILNQEGDGSKLRGGDRLQGRHEGRGTQVDQQSDQCLEKSCAKRRIFKSMEEETWSFCALDVNIFVYKEIFVIMLSSIKKTRMSRNMGVLRHCVTW